MPRYRLITSATPVGGFSEFTEPDDNAAIAYARTHLYGDEVIRSLAETLGGSTVRTIVVPATPDPGDRSLRHAITYSSTSDHGPVTWTCAIDNETGTEPDYPTAHNAGMVHEHGRELVHVAADDGSGHCPVCGAPVHGIADGRLVHTATLAIAARTPEVVLAARLLVADWRQQASELSPDVSEFHENTPEEETADTIAETYVDLSNALAAVLDGSPTDA